MNLADWNRGQLVGELLIVIAATGLVSSRDVRGRIAAVTVLAQGIAMLFATAGAYYSRAELGIAAVAIVAVGLIWASWFARGNLIRSLPSESSGEVSAMNRVDPDMDSRSGVE